MCVCVQECGRSELKFIVDTGLYLGYVISRDQSRDHVTSHVPRVRDSVMRLDYATGRGSRAVTWLGRVTCRMPSAVDSCVRRIRDSIM